LPKYGGKGMYGMNVHQAVFDAKETESGCTVHRVSEQYDEGTIVVQKRCSITTEDTPNTIAAKVLELEQLAYPEALKLLTEELKQEFIT
jgi:phosphoribosylglycinamide formyltransferase-1